MVSTHRWKKIYLSKYSETPNKGCLHFQEMSQIRDFSASPLFAIFFFRVGQIRDFWMKIQYKVLLLRSNCAWKDLQRWFSGLFISLEWRSFWFVFRLFFSNFWCKLKVLYLSFFDFESNKGLFTLSQSSLFGVYFRVPYLELVHIVNHEKSSSAEAGRWYWSHAFVKETKTW